MAPGVLATASPLNLLNAGPGSCLFPVEASLPCRHPAQVTCALGHLVARAFAPTCVLAPCSADRSHVCSCLQTHFTYLQCLATSSPGAGLPAWNPHVPPARETRRGPLRSSAAGWSASGPAEPQHDRLDGRQPRASQEFWLPRATGTKKTTGLRQKICEAGRWEGRGREGIGSGWTVEDSAVLYGIQGWGSPYFCINKEGHVAVSPDGDPQGDPIDLVSVVDQLQQELGLLPPVILRFPQIIGHRLQLLQDSFSAAFARFNYKGSYRGVFPVKCNRDWRILQSFVDYGLPFHFGLEAGSKPELLAAIAALQRSPGSLLICNGYKDKAYIEIALLAKHLGVNAMLVLEQAEELKLVLEVSEALGIEPEIGVRAKLSTRAQGHWADTAGDRGKFGLNATQMIDAVNTLKERGKLQCLKLLHFHFGSQISDIAVIKEAMREGSHIYAELALLGAPMGHIDVGGGLGIDYDGTRSATPASLNYSMQAYANDVVAAVVDACRLKGVAHHPCITSESGRALASHQSVLVFNVRNATVFAESLTQQHLLVALMEEEQEQERDRREGQGHQQGTGQEEREGAVQGQGQDSDRGPVSEGGTRIGEEEGATRDRASADGSGNQTVGQYLLRTFREVYDSMDGSNFQEAYNDAKQFKKEAASLFKLGCLSLVQRAQVDALFLAVCHRVLQFSTSTSSTARSPSSIPQSEIGEIKQSLSAVYHCNLSIFRSAPDSWAIQQLFPVMPLGRLCEEPAVEATLADLTCDSDGKIGRFISDGTNGGRPRTSLRLHALRDGQQYLLGLFLGGVYQEAMGSSHNMFGSVTTVYLRTDGCSAPALNNTDGTGRPYEPGAARPGRESATDTSNDFHGGPSPCIGAGSHGDPGDRKRGSGGFCVDHIIRGDTIEQVLETSQPEMAQVKDILHRSVEEVASSGLLPSGDVERLKRCLERNFRAYTYLE